MILSVSCLVIQEQKTLHLCVFKSILKTTGYRGGEAERWTGSRGGEMQTVTPRNDRQQARELYSLPWYKSYIVYICNYIYIFIHTLSVRMTDSLLHGGDWRNTAD